MAETEESTFKTKLFCPANPGKDNAREMLASGKKRVCCFDQSGHYSKSLSAPGAKD